MSNELVSFSKTIVEKLLEVIEQEPNKASLISHFITSHSLDSVADLLHSGCTWQYGPRCLQLHCILIQSKHIAFMSMVLVRK